MENCREVVEKKFEELDFNMNHHNGEVDKQIADEILNPAKIIDDAFEMTKFPGSATC
jgi:hypothetical protein